MVVVGPAPRPISTSHLAPLRLGSLLHGVVARGAVVSERGESVPADAGGLLTATQEGEGVVSSSAE